MATKNGNNADRRAQLQQHAQEVEMMDDRPIVGDEREMVRDMEEGRERLNAPTKGRLLAGGLGLAALGIAALLLRSRVQRRRRGRRSWLRPRRLIGFLRPRAWRL